LFSSKKVIHLPQIINLNKMDKKENTNKSSKFITVLGWLATVASVGMYVAYIDQIKATWDDATGPWIQPMVAGINCTLWFIYALFKKERDYPIALANAPGIVLGFTAAFTALF